MNHTTTTMTLGELITKMTEEHVEDTDAMVTALCGSTEELIDALLTCSQLLDGMESRVERQRVLLGVLGFGVAIGYYRALQIEDELLGLCQGVRNGRGGQEPC